MKKISCLTILAVVFLFSVPIFVGAANSGGCNSAGGPCNFGRVAGTCAQNQETGDFYCNQLSSSGSVNETYLRLYYDLVLTVVNSYLVPILIAISFIVFLWGVFNYFIYGASDETKRKEGRQFVLWGIIGLVIIFSTWALVNIVKGTLFPTTVQNTAPTPPRL